MLLLSLINCVSLNNDTGKRSFTEKQNSQDEVNTDQEDLFEGESDSDTEDEESNNSERPNDSDVPDNTEESSPNNGESSGSSYNAITSSYSVPSNSTSGTTTISSIPIPSGVISDVKVLLSVEHTCTKDLSAMLTSPNGTTVSLFDLSGMVVCSSNIDTTTFDDEGTLLLDQGNSPFSGTYKPIDSLSNFDGENPAGVWNLTIVDDTVGDSGKLTDWVFEFTF